jgi:hypothetical protein
MAAVQVVMAFPASTAFRRRASVAGLQGRRTVRVACVVGEQSGDGGQQEAAVDILQSSRNPLLNLAREDLMAALEEKQAPVAESAGRRRGSERVVFTAEKARLLRKENRATQTFHDQWYHSAIASKLAMPE